MIEYLRRLGQRKMAQWALAYAAAAWVALQALSLASDSYGWSPLVMRVAIGLALIGLLVCLVLAWYHGERGEQKTSGTELLILAGLLVLGGGVLWQSERQHASAPAAVAATPPAAPIAAKAVVNPRSIAVLPFANLSADQDNTYFVEGMQDEILTRLSKIADLKVISRTSTRHYATSPENLPEIAAELGVANILEGSVQKVGDSVRINVQLIRADDETHLWAEIYDRKLVDVFSIQSEVTTAIAKALQATLSVDEQRVVAALPTTNTAAYDAYLHGLALDDRSAHDLAVAPQARDQFAKAVRLDPDFAEAWRHLVQVTSLMYFNEIERTPAALARMESAVAQVSRLQPDSSEAWLAQGFYAYRALRDFPTALVAFRKANALAPNNAEALMAIALIERRSGQMPSALVHVAQAEQLDPRNPQYVQSKGEFLLAVRRYPEARAAYDRALELLPGDPSFLAVKIASFQNQGDLPAAQRMIDALPADARDDPFLETRQVQSWLTGRTDQVISRCRAVVKAGQSAGDLGAYYVLICQFQIASAQRLQGDATGAVETGRAMLKQLDRPESADLGKTGRAELRGLANACVGNKAQALHDLQVAIDSLHGDTRELPALEVGLALVHAQFGDVDAAVALLRRSLQVPYGVTVAHLRLMPMWRPIRDDPRFQALLASPQG